MPETNTLLGGGGFHHVAMRVKDIRRTIDFYTATLGFKARLIWGKDGQPTGALLDTGDGNYLEVFSGGTGPKPEGTIFHVCFRCKDVDAAIGRARDAGMKITMEPKDIVIEGLTTGEKAHARIAFFEGPDGESVEFFAGNDL